MTKHPNDAPEAEATEAARDGFIPDDLADEPTAGDALAEAQDRVLRLQAEIENVRKRAQRDVEEGLRFANLPLIEDLLPVLDNLTRATESASTEATAAGLVDGVQMVVRQLEEVLARRGCGRIEPAPGEEFDPHVHEALLQQPSDDAPAGSVATLVQAGYQLHDRVVRPAKVIVSSGPPTGE